MTLSFSQTWPDRMGKLAGQPNYFLEKIWIGLREHDVDLYWLRHKMKFGDYWDESLSPVEPKLHTIRLDPHDRWKPEMKIHMVINNRAKNRFQFAPVLECVSVQTISILHYRDFPEVRVDDFRLIGNVLEDLARNDGFSTTEEFFDYFNEDFTGKIIHWTDFKY